jgi:ankyrin repeat protein
MLGVHHGRAKAVFALINAGASPMVCDSTGKSALHWAAESQDDTMISVVLSAPQADIVAKDNEGNTPLHAAVALGNLEIVAMMLDARPGADLTAVDGTGRTALHWAVASGHHNIVTALIATAGAARGRNARLLDIQDAHGGTALHYAAQLNYVQCVRALTQAGARSLPDHEGRYPLQWAIMDSRDGTHSAAVLALAASKGFTLDSRDAEQLTAVHLVATVGDSRLAATLLDTFEVDLTARDTEGKTPLLTACEAGATDVALELIAHDADVSVADNEGRTALVWACINGHDEVAMAMLDAGADVGAADSSGKTPLMYAAYQGMMPAVEALLDAMASPDARDVDGVTALHWASLEGHADIVNALLVAGANPNITELADSRSTPLDYAALNGHTGVVRLLRSVGGVPTVELDIEELVAPEVALKAEALDDQAQAAVPRDVPAAAAARQEVDRANDEQTDEVAAGAPVVATAADETVSAEEKRATSAASEAAGTSTTTAATTERVNLDDGEQTRDAETRAPVVTTAAEDAETLVTTAAERAETRAPVAATAAERAETRAPVVATAAEEAETRAPVVATAAEDAETVVTTAAERTETCAPVAATAAKDVETRAPVVATAEGADVHEQESARGGQVTDDTSPSLAVNSSPQDAMSEFHKAKRASAERMVRERLAKANASDDVVFTSRDGESFVAAHARIVEFERARRSDADRALMRDMLVRDSGKDTAVGMQQSRTAKALAVYKTQHVTNVIESRRKARAAAITRAAIVIQRAWREYRARVASAAQSKTRRGSRPMSATARGRSR